MHPILLRNVLDVSFELKPKEIYVGIFENYERNYVADLSTYWYSINSVYVLCKEYVF